MNGTLMGYTATGGSKIERTFSSFMKEVFLTTDGPEVVLSLKGPFYTRQRQSVVDEVVEKIKAEYADWHNGMKGLDKGEVFTILSVLSDYRIEKKSDSEEDEFGPVNLNDVEPDILKKSSIVEPEDNADLHDITRIPVPPACSGDEDSPLIDEYVEKIKSPEADVKRLLQDFSIKMTIEAIKKDRPEAPDFDKYVDSTPECEHGVINGPAMKCVDCGEPYLTEPSKASGIDECVEEYHLKATYTLVDRLRPLNPDEMREILTKHWPRRDK